MTLSTSRPTRKPEAAAPRPKSVFRDFVRRLEKIEAGTRKEGGR